MGYRLNAASVLMTADQMDNAEAVLKEALRISRTPTNQSIFQSRIDEIERYKNAKAASARAEAEPAGQPRVVETEEAVKVDNVAPKHPAMPVKGPRHTVLGVLRKVACSYPAAIEFRVEGVKKSVSLYNNNFVDLDLSVLGFTPSGAMDPCHQFEGMKAKVEYIDSTDKSVDGQAVAVELRK
jgi:hypothetical protein